MKRIADLCRESGLGDPVELTLPKGFKRALKDGKIKINIMALGDVGTNILIGLKTLGGDVISEIGIYDIDENRIRRLEMEMGQIYGGEGTRGNGVEMPRVRGIDYDRIGDCHMLIFCASRGIPEPGPGVDVRMAQLDANSKIVSGLTEKLNEVNYDGLISVVSDPVDPLCGEFLRLGQFTPGQIRGWGLGVMYARGRYYAEMDEKFYSYLKEGRAFGPHGSDLVLANSVKNYDDVVSRELTELAVKANMKVRDLGYKPFLAPAFSSGVFSILNFLRGEWNYGSLYMGDGSDGAFLGMRSRLDGDKIIFDDEDMPDELYERIKTSYTNLLELNQKRNAL